MQYTNCCKGGVLTSQGQDSTGAIPAFQMGVVQDSLEETNKTVKLPQDFKLHGQGHSSGPAKRVPSTVILKNDCRRKAQALSMYTNFLY